ncbi:SRPBCC domain-containing protein [Winogradskyella maritima]|uniref:SRPBCC domain-containing protein n=1 Tax=Winogradskyella maritima TaxID=1517766 RepID=A0ABV8AM68_9FLAO|nr:SRPBCC domain-containing protein [Winogradskyella maritima]
MKKFLFITLFSCFLVSSFSSISAQGRVESIVDSSQFNNMVLKQSFVVQVGVDSVWNAYTTKNGWESWATAIAEVDFKINGTIKTNYNKDGQVGDNSTIVLHVINYVPKRMITLQAELTENFPEFMKEDEKNLYNMILFEEIDAAKTKITSYGIGYKHNEKYMSLMKFFIKGNEQSYHNLISYLETGNPSVKY